MATPDAAASGEEESELDRLAVDSFLDTLAEVALAVAKRQSRLAGMSDAGGREAR